MEHLTNVGAAGHLAVRGKNLNRMVGTYGGGGSLREQFHLDRQDSDIVLTGLYGNNPSTLTKDSTPPEPSFRPKAGQVS